MAEVGTRCAVIGRGRKYSFFSLLCRELCNSSISVVPRFAPIVFVQGSAGKKGSGTLIEIFEDESRLAGSSVNMEILTSSSHLLHGRFWSSLTP